MDEGDGLFTRSDAWSGGFFELSLELGPEDDHRLRDALVALWSHPDLAGCYLERGREPDAQPRIDVRDAPLGAQLLGVANVGDLGSVTCLSFVVRMEGRDWLGFGLPVGSLDEILPMGAFPFEDGSSLSWREALNEWLRELASHVFDRVGFELGVIGHDVTAEVSAANLRSVGVPEERFAGYLIPENGRLAWYGPTEGAPVTVGTPQPEGSSVSMGTRPRPSWRVSFGIATLLGLAMVVSLFVGLPVPGAVLAKLWLPAGFLAGSITNIHTISNLALGCCFVVLIYAPLIHAGRRFFESLRNKIQDQRFDTSARS